ncbi:hypothetical protein Gohar_011085, partial [Gossypium harknessii]|nr:hypothetical protein [Gossypium harknessii]
METEFAKLKINEEEEEILQFDFKPRVETEDMERVLKGSPWTFNNHLLLLHKLQLTEDPLI